MTMNELDKINEQIAQLTAARDALVAQQVANPNASALDPVTQRMIDAMLGMHHMLDNEATRQRDRNINDYMASLDQYHNGNVSLGDLKDDADFAYLANMAGPYFEKTRQDLRWAGLVGGRTGEINAAFSRGEAWRNNYPAADYGGKLKPILAAMMGE